MKIGVFDSGIGGITVLKEVLNHFPQAHYIYLGDTANLPYGTKSASQIEKLSIKNALRLKKQSIDVLIVACNTVSSSALTALQDIMHPVPVLGVVTPGVQSALDHLPHSSAPIVVFATSATVKSHAYLELFHKNRPELTVFEQACPLLVPFIEEGLIEHSALDSILQDYIIPYLPLQPGVALLGCTHYPWIESVFQRYLPQWTIVHSAKALSEQLRYITLWQPPHPTTIPTIEWCFTEETTLSAFAYEKIEEIHRCHHHLPITTRPTPQKIRSGAY